MDESFDFSNMSDDNKIKLLGILTTIIVACIGGIFALMAAFVQRPTPSANPTQVIVVINATPIPTSVFLPTFTPFPTQQVTEPTTSTPTTITEPTEPSQSNNIASAPNSKFSVPWSDWIINFVMFMPQDTWIAIVIFLGILFLVAGGAIFFSVKLSSDFRYVFMFVAIIITFIISISKWGWWGILWGFFLLYPVVIVLGIKFIFGAITGGISGILISTSLSLFYMTWIGYINKELITSWNVVGFLIGLIVGIIFIHESIFDT